MKNFTTIQQFSHDIASTYYVSTLVSSSSHPQRRGKGAFDEPPAVMVADTAG
jgi:hypothetical protein